MPETAPRATFLLPPRERFGGQRVGERAARALGRADAVRGAEGERAQLRRHVTLVPDHWPLAALARRVDARDADTACWLRADPAHVRAGMSGATLMACGDMLALDAAEADALLRPLRPLFGDTGFTIDAPVPGHWYLRLPRGAKLPAFVEPGDALGADVFEQLPEGEDGRRWRALLNESQVILHNHPVNQRRSLEGRLPVNSLWFWGGGVLPDQHACDADVAWSDDEAACALFAPAARVAALPTRFAAQDGALLADLRPLRDVAVFEREWLLPALDALACGGIDLLQLDFGDGRQLHLRHGQRWRFWRRPVPQIGL